MSTVRTDFFLDPAHRLTEQERALMTAMLHCLVNELADELLAALPAGVAAANDGDHGSLFTRLHGAGLLDQRDLIGVLLRRADEERIASAIRARAEGGRQRFLQALVGDDDSAVSAAAMALILARGRRRDRLGQPCLEFDDLPAETALTLLQSIAAALRQRMIVHLNAIDADRQLAAACDAQIGRHDPAKRIELLSNDLVRALDGAGKLTEDLLADAVGEGEIGLLAEALAHKAGIASDTAWDHLLGGSGGRLMVLLRLAGVSRQFGAQLIVGLGELIGIVDAGAEIARFDAFSDDQVRAARDLMSLDPRYRDALIALGDSDG